MIVGGLMALPLCGCGKKPDSAVAVVRPLPPNSPVLRDPAVQANLKQLNQALINHVPQHGMPRNFEELVADAKITVPPPPTGMRYIVTSGAVTLGNVPGAAQTSN